MFEAVHCGIESRRPACRRLDFAIEQPRKVDKWLKYSVRMEPMIVLALDVPLVRS